MVLVVLHKAKMDAGGGLKLERIIRRTQRQERGFRDRVKPFAAVMGRMTWHLVFFAVGASSNAGGAMKLNDSSTKQSV